VDANAGEGASRVFSLVAGGDTETSTDGDAEASTGDDAEASTDGTISLITSLIPSTKDFEVDLLRAETGSYPSLRAQSICGANFSSHVLRC
jgi:hypothetical protein